MKESLLHYIWKTQSFEKSNLKTSKRESCSVLRTGIHNSDAGPDFSQAKIKINDVVWCGHVEIHVKASEWYQHNHQSDPAYENVILHVVWENDREVILKDGTAIPTLSLKNLISDNLISRFSSLESSNFEIACHKSAFSNVRELTVQSMLERVLVERFEKKAKSILKLKKHYNGDWETVCYIEFAKAFGLFTNKESFQKLSELVPFNTVKRIKDQKIQLFALFYGQAGLLNEIPTDTYQEKLQNEFKYLQKKYSLKKAMNPVEWKFSTLRIYSFPTIRIARFILFIKECDSLLNLALSITQYKDLRQVINKNSDTYWSNHYHFDKKSNKDYSKIGKDFTERVILNCILPIQMAYMIEYDMQDKYEKAWNLLQTLKFEENKFTKKFSHFELERKSAFDSQALLELYHQYCTRKRCLSCNIGCELIRTES